MAKCPKCGGKGYQNIRLSIGDANWPKHYTPGVTNLIRVQPCVECRGTGNTDRRAEDPRLLKILFG